MGKIRDDSVTWKDLVGECETSDSCSWWQEIDANWLRLIVFRYRMSLIIFSRNDFCGPNW